MTGECTLPHDAPLTVSVAQLGARMHYAVPRILNAAGMLERFYTDFVVARPWPSLLGALRAIEGNNAALSRMQARLPDGIPYERITHWPRFAIEYNIRQRRAQTPEEVAATHLWAGAEFCRRIIRHGLGNATAVYTYNSAGLELLEHARERGLLRVMEQTIAPRLVENRLLAEEHSAWPDWEAPRHVGPCCAAFAARERAEWEYANLIVCGSEFVRRGIAECRGPVDRCIVVPYGVDARAAQAPAARASRPRLRLRILIAGEVGLRKGAPYVLQAARTARAWAEFRWCGGIGLRPEAAAKLQEHIELPGAVPRPRMAEHYAWADLFLLPSICEGSATACYEALAAGLPVIATENAGSVVRDGVEGYIVPIRNPSAIEERLERLQHNRDLLECMSRAALERAQEFTVAKYAERLLAALALARGVAAP